MSPVRGRTACSARDSRFVYKPSPGGRDGPSCRRQPPGVVGRVLRSVGSLLVSWAVGSVPRAASGAWAVCSVPKAGLPIAGGFLPVPKSVGPRGEAVCPSRGAAEWA